MKQLKLKPAHRPKIFRAYDLVRDKTGAVCKMLWRGDFLIPGKPTQEQIESKKLKEWERLYGKRS